LAVALTMAGFCLMGSCKFVGPRLWFSLLLMFLGASTAPRTSFFALILILFGCWQWMKSSSKNRLLVGGLAISAVVCAGIVFLVLIHFRLGQFMETFHVHASRIQSGKWELFQRFVSGMGSRWLPIFALTIVVLFWSAFRPARQSSGMYYALA